MGSPRDTASYSGWEEVYSSDHKGGREVRYYLKTRDGGLDLAVVGKENSSKHMSYYCAKDRNISCKLKSRRDVIDWLNSMASDEFPHQLFLSSSDNTPENGALLYTETCKDAKYRNVGHYFSWIGAPTCRKRRKHYASFYRNGVRISIHDIVYVLAEENKRLIAYLEDMYEDSRDNKMVVVRWFHKIDEVEFVLPHKFNDREIFFSLCLQDINVECIDGLATVLSPFHYEKLLKVATQIQPDAFVCQKLFDNDDVKPFDITQVKGYWRQKLLKYLCGAPTVKLDSFHRKPSVGQKAELTKDHRYGVRPTKKCRLSKDGLSLYYTVPVEVLGEPCVGKNGKCTKDDLKLPVSLADPCKETRQVSPCLKVGDKVEVLSEDSGIRGCWFRALIIKKHKDKLKVQYQDLQDAADEANKLEEWISASWIASPDKYGLRISGRTRIRPAASSGGTIKCAGEVGSVVDVWWCDGWWEGIIVQEESKGNCRVYLPGEELVSVVQHDNLRLSQEWCRNKWTPMKARPELVSSILSSCKDMKQVGHDEPTQVSIHDGNLSTKDEARLSHSHTKSCTNTTASFAQAPNLLKDALLSQLKWSSSRKRKRGSGCSIPKPYLDCNVQGTSLVAVTSRTAERAVVHASLKRDSENCKNIGDPLFSSSVVPSLTSLVMSR